MSKDQEIYCSKIYLVRAHESVANQGAKSAKLEMLLSKTKFEMKFRLFTILDGVNFTVQQPDCEERFSCHDWSWRHLAT